MEKLITCILNTFLYLLLFASSAQAQQRHSGHLVMSIDSSLYAYAKDYYDKFFYVREENLNGRTWYNLTEKPEPISIPTALSEPATRPVNHRRMFGERPAQFRKGKVDTIYQKSTVRKTGDPQFRVYPYIISTASDTIICWVHHHGDAVKGKDGYYRYPEYIDSCYLFKSKVFPHIQNIHTKRYIELDNIIYIEGVDLNMEVNKNIKE